jgi:hypothetical protein
MDGNEDDDDAVNEDELGDLDVEEYINGDPDDGTESSSSDFID